MTKFDDAMLDMILLRRGYEAYRENCRKWWHWEHDAVMSFDDWFRASADEAKDHAKYKD